MRNLVGPYGSYGLLERARQRLDEAGMLEGRRRSEGGREGGDGRTGRETDRRKDGAE